LQYTNLASTLTEGVDYELDYSWDLRYWNIPGAFSVRGLATHANGFRTCPNTAGSFCTDYAGANGNYSTSTAYAAAYGTLPKWKTDFSEQYGNTWGSIYIAQRWFSSGTFSNNDIQCNPGSCPAETATQVADFPTINYNHMPGAIYWDAGVTINAGAHAELYGKVNNIFNDLAPPTASGGVNNTLYDIIGRMFYFGFRLNY
jgi:outer membrane receptor protein involved in Fe transport